jgi:hypothetical protein
MPLRPRAGTHPILETILDQQTSAVALVTLLLRIITARQPLPPKAPLYRPQDAGRTGVLQFVRSAAGEPPRAGAARLWGPVGPDGQAVRRAPGLLRRCPRQRRWRRCRAPFARLTAAGLCCSAAATMLWLPIRTVQWFIRPSTAADQASPLADLAMLLLLVLVHHRSPNPQEPNPYRRALQDMQVRRAACPPAACCLQPAPCCLLPRQGPAGCSSPHARTSGPAPRRRSPRAALHRAAPARCTAGL